jgi:hypothetical protein
VADEGSKKLKVKIKFRIKFKIEVLVWALCAHTVFVWFAFGVRYAHIAFWFLLLIYLPLCTASIHHKQAGI